MNDKKQQTNRKKIINNFFSSKFFFILKPLLITRDEIFGNVDEIVSFTCEWIQILDFYF